MASFSFVHIATLLALISLGFAAEIPKGCDPNSLVELKLSVPISISQCLSKFQIQALGAQCGIQELLSKVFQLILCLVTDLPNLLEGLTNVDALEKALVGLVGNLLQFVLPIISDPSTQLKDLVNFVKYVLYMILIIIMSLTDNPMVHTLVALLAGILDAVTSMLASGGSLSLKDVFAKANVGSLLNLLNASPLLQNLIALVLEALSLLTMTLNQIQLKALTKLLEIVPSLVGQINEAVKGLEGLLDPDVITKLLGTVAGTLSGVLGNLTGPTGLGLLGALTTLVGGVLNLVGTLVGGILGTLLGILGGISISI